MKKTMVYLPDDVHEGLRRLAFDRRVSVAELIHGAVEAACGEVLEDICDAESELADYLAPDDVAETFVTCGISEEVRKKIEPLWEAADSLLLARPAYSLPPDKIIASPGAIASTFYG